MGYLHLFVLLIVSLGSVVMQSHFCPVQYEVTKTRQAATRYRCGEWNQQWCTRYKLEYYTDIFIDGTVCCENFTGENCDIPICDPPCLSPSPCIVDGDQNICDCQGGFSGDACDIEPTTTVPTTTEEGTSTPSDLGGENPSTTDIETSEPSTSDDNNSGCRQAILTFHPILVLLTFIKLLP